MTIRNIIFFMMLFGASLALVLYSSKSESLVGDYWFGGCDKNNNCLPEHTSPNKPGEYTLAEQPTITFQPCDPMGCIEAFFILDILDNNLIIKSIMPDFGSSGAPLKLYHINNSNPDDAVLIGLLTELGTEYTLEANQTYKVTAFFTAKFELTKAPVL